MAFSQEAYAAAAAELKKRRDEAQFQFEKRSLEMAEKAPEIAALNRKLMNTNLEISRAIITKDVNLQKALAEIRDANLRHQKLIRELLMDLGYPADYLDMHYTCTKCGDTGFVEGIRCDCFEELIHKHEIELLNSSCKMKLHDFSEFSLDYYPEIQGTLRPRERMRAVYEFCMDYAEHFTPDADSLLFLGKTGLGKTFLSSAIAKSLFERGYYAAFDSVQNFLRAVENEHFGRTQGNTMETLIDCDLVILDDLGSEFKTSFTHSALYNIINTRINEGKPTIISTNLDSGELSALYNERIISRITGMFRPIMFFGNDIRQVKRRNTLQK